MFANLPTNYVHMLEMCLGEAHFQVSGCEQFVKTGRGCNAGGPFADVLFVYLMARLLRNIDAKIASVHPGFHYELVNSVLGRGDQPPA